MADVSDPTMSVAEAAERLGITVANAYELVFAGELRTVAGQTGRRLVPVDALEALVRLREATGTSV
jgi:excisionase family DNA binding protein